MLDNRFYSVTTDRESDNYINTTLVGKKVTESSTIEINSYSYSPTLGTHINSGSTTKGTIEFPIGYLRQGDKVTLSAEFYSMSGVRPKLVIEFNVSGMSGIGAAVATYQSDKTGEFETTQYTHVAEADGFYRAVFGVATGDIGEFYVRNPFASIQTIVGLNKFEPVNYRRAVKQFTFTISNGVPVMQQVYSYDQATLTIDSVDTTKMKLTFSTPFTDTTKRVVVVDGLASFLDSFKYVLKFENTFHNEITFYIYNIATNTRVAASTLPNGVYFHFVVHGYDLI